MYNPSTYLVVVTYFFTYIPTSVNPVHNAPRQSPHPVLRISHSGSLPPIKTPRTISAGSLCTITVVIRLSPHFFKSASRISPHSVGLKMWINIYGSVYCPHCLQSSSSFSFKLFFFLPAVSLLFINVHPLLLIVSSRHIQYLTHNQRKPCPCKSMQH